MGVVEAFLLCLCHPDATGRILISRSAEASSSSFKFLQLDPFMSFKPVLEEARAVILAGGTLQPFEGLVEQLFSSVPPERLHIFSCDHIVPPDRVLALSVPSGPGGHDLDITFGARSSAVLLEELGRAVLEIVSLVPDGVVLFFPSYGYEDQVMQSWRQSGWQAKIEAKKTIFREPRGAGQVDDVLRKYQAAIEQRRDRGGALLSCVVGGKMSEGINFADALGRCVVMIGMPYANKRDPVLQERMAHVQHKYKDSNPQAGQALYENLCFKAINQSIGRAIRHAGDYAAIVLLDKRYCRPAVPQRLPRWIAKSHAAVDSFAQARTRLASFFARFPASK